MPTTVIGEFIDRDALLRLDLAPALADARVLIVHNRTRVDATLLAAAPHLEAVGLDNIDLAACSDRSVTIHPPTGRRSNRSRQ
ncbi:D-isomer specific 2-hydroxyacid dehydrogenase catalytic region-containing protein [Rhizobium sp. CF080]|uniref:D-isomer specific 2-hydroxyacid dehydrogenase n=1 Tax=Rhizobium sp. (strain CF080) TaxID=1144310 RepID=UPI0002718177|nr:D-isomer specific 2-hydroxyacid dehydrogenase [Rhizobium sp. CF080]EUC00012.1 D-isomer specific 2-hydroxyacid dehydrogenase catalytic region-containing protein [Rhizobium sp. CF080]